MGPTSKKDRLSIDVLPEEHKQIKIFATLNGETIREFVLKSIHERLQQEMESKDLSRMTSNLSPALLELWDNDKDSVYDEI